MFDQILDAWVSSIDTQNEWLIYLVLGISALIENIFPPAPGDTVTVLGAFLVGIGKLDFVTVYIVTTIASIAGFMLLYWVGRALGRSFFVKHNFRFFSVSILEKAEVLFQKYGIWIVALNRFMMGIRSVVSLIAGITRMRWQVILLLATVSCLLWNLLLIYLGYLLAQAMGGDWAQVKTNVEYFLSNYSLIFYGIVLAGIIYFIIRFFIRKRSTIK